jgi:hypothetical protein
VKVRPISVTQQRQLFCNEFGMIIGMKEIVMVTKQKKRWGYSPPKPTKPPISDVLKSEVETKAEQFVQKLKFAHIQPPPLNPQFNFLIDIWTKWYRGYFYFCGTYASPFKNALSPTFEVRFARMEYCGNRKFNLAYMRHTDQWLEVFTDIPLDEALETICTEPYFMPT